jgi:Tol biopolymer transport system component
MWGWGCCRFVPALLVAALVCATPALAAWPGTNERLAFDTYAPGKQVRTSTIDGRRQRVVAHFDFLPPIGLQSHSGVPQWSPSGDRLLYQRLGSGFEIARTDGRGRRLIKTPFLWPSWSPDGREILAVDATTTPYRLVRMRTDGSRRRHIRIPPDASVALPRWSPTGRWILYEEGTPEGVFITHVRPDGTGLRSLAQGRLYSWSPDGRRFAYATGREIWSMQPDGGGRRRLSRGRENTAVVSLAWSPDGRRIALVRHAPEDEHDTSTVATIPAGGGREKRMFGGERFIGLIDWQPR